VGICQEIGLTPDGRFDLISLTIRFAGFSGRAGIVQSTNHGLDIPSVLWTLGVMHA
jgi:hypothetical protein